MAKLIKDGRNEIGGTSLVGEFIARESELRALLGEPGEGDGYKVSLEWYGRVTEDEHTDMRGRVFTIYDWKETSLYDDALASPEHLRALDFPREWHIGGHDKRTAELVLEALREALPADLGLDRGGRAW